MITQGQCVKYDFVAPLENAAGVYTSKCAKKDEFSCVILDERLKQAKLARTNENNLLSKMKKKWENYKYLT